MSFIQELGKRILFLDGAMGTQLQANGLKPGELPETWNVNKPEVVKAIHQAYLEAGADIILTNTFGANSLKYPDCVEELVVAGVANAKRAVAECGRTAYVALDMGPTGRLLKPMGTLDFEEAVALYKQVAEIGEKSGADLIVIETMSDTYELKAAVLGAKEGSSLPILASVVFGESGNMLTGATPETVVALLEGLGVDVIGMNCSLGPKQLKPIFERMEAAASVPLVISPNAGLPRTVGGQTFYDVSSEEFAEDMVDLIHMGAWIAGGCCGTTPEHIRALVDKCGELSPVVLSKKDKVYVSSYSQAVLLDENVNIVECISPDCQEEYRQALLEQDIDFVIDEAEEKLDDGADVLRIHVGVDGVNEAAMLKNVVYELQSLLDTPLQIYTSDVEALEQALRIYNGKPMVQFVSEDAESRECAVKLVKKYGGAIEFINLS